MNSTKMPQQGDVIEVRDHIMDPWEHRTFICCYEDKVFCLVTGTKNNGVIWNQWRWPQEEAPYSCGTDYVQTKEEVKSTEDVKTPKSDTEEQRRAFYNHYVETVIKPNLKSCFPPPPPGREWQNPDNLTPEQVEIDKGWRLKLKGEEWEEEQDRNLLQIFIKSHKTWAFFHVKGIDSNATYRTKHPLPVERKKVPLEAKDWKGVWFVKEKYQAETVYSLVESVGVFGISIGAYGATDFDNLQKDWLRSRDCENWEICAKDEEV